MDNCETSKKRASKPYSNGGVRNNFGGGVGERIKTPQEVAIEVGGQRRGNAIAAKRTKGGNGGIFASS